MATRQRRRAQRAGRVYVLRNEHMRELLVKVGKTVREAENRAKELTKATGVPGKYHVLVQEYVYDVDYAERLIHDRLMSYRLQPNREFFQLPYELAIRTVISICAQVNRERDISKASNVKRMRLLFTGSQDARTLMDLLGPFRNRPRSNVQVVVSFESHGAACDVCLGDDWRVELSPFLVERLQAWLGKDGVLFSTIPDRRQSTDMPF